MYTFDEMQRNDAAHDMENHISENLISEICAYRQIFNVSQRELSKLSGVTQNVISRMENDLVTPKLKTLAKLLDALDLDIEIKVTPRKENKRLDNIDQNKLATMLKLSNQLSN